MKGKIEDFISQTQTVLNRLKKDMFFTRVLTNQVEIKCGKNGEIIKYVTDFYPSDTRFKRIIYVPFENIDGDVWRWYEEKLKINGEVYYRIGTGTLTDVVVGTPEDTCKEITDMQIKHIKENINDVIRNKLLYEDIFKEQSEQVNIPIIPDKSEFDRFFEE